MKRILPSAILLLALSPLASAQTVAPPFNSVYSVVPLGSVAGLPTSYGGLAFKDGDRNTLLIGGVANGASGRIYAVPVTRGAGGHIAGFGTPVAQGYGAFNDSGITYGPGGVLFYSKYPNNQVAQVKPGANADSAVTNLSSLGIASSPGALVFVPAGYNGANRLKISSYRDGKFYDVPYSPKGDGTYALGNASPKATLTGGPEGLIYAPIGSPLFTNQTLLVTEYSSGDVAAYDIDAEGNPIVGTRRNFITGLSGGEGAAIDPVTGDFLFTSYGTNTLFQVRGFTPPPPPATVTVTSSANPSSFGATVAFTATVTGVAPVSGTVTFKDNGTDIAGCVGVALSAGSVGCVTSTLAVGSRTIAAYYGGNTTNAASSGSLTQTVNGLPPGTTTPPAGATSVTTGGATLQGTVTGNGLATTASFQYGTSTAYGSTVAATPGSVGPTAVNQAVSASVTGLNCGTTYFYRVQAVNSAGTAFGADSSFTTLPCPTLVSLSPDRGPVAGGSTVTFTGTGFGAGIFVNRNGTPGACSNGVTVLSPTSARCVLQPNSAGTVNLSVGMPGGVSNALPYTYDSKPTLANSATFSPPRGPTGGGWLTTMKGTGFVAGMTVNVAGAATPCQPVTVQSQTTASCLMPPHPLGAASVTVTTPGGTSNAVSVIYIDAPDLTAISPARGPTAGGTTITLTGSSFFAVINITVGGVPCASKRVVSLTEATCTTPPGAAGSAGVVVTNAAGSSTPVPFVYDSVPTVTGVKPSQGPSAGGTQITVSGTSFVAGSTAVSVGGQACGAVRHLSDAKLTCVTPAGTAGAANVVVTTPGGASAPGTFTYDDKPAITAVSPAQGALAGGTTITVTGTSFVASRTTVTVGGAACASVAVADSTTLTCAVPAAGSAGVVEVIATTPGGASASGFYTYDDVPTVAAVSPDQGPVAGGTAITVTGTAFVPGATTVSVGGAACAAVSVADATSLTCTTPAGTSGVKEVTVTTPGGTSAPLFFTYDNQPVVKSVKPSQGPLAGGTTITLTGASFIAGATTVSVGGAACGSVAVSGDKTLTCVTPAGAAGTVNVTVTTAGGTSGPLSFTYDNLPSIAAVSPDQGPVAGGTTITVTGTSFVAGVTTVSVGGAACGSVNVTSSTSLTCVTPAGAAGVATVRVTTPGGSSNALDFSYEPVPTLSSVSPGEGPAAGGTVVTITGAGFRVPGTTVTVGGAPCTGVNVTSATSLTCTTPARTAGTAGVIATTPGGSSNSLAFTYDAVPGLATVSPARGPAAGGTTITLGGSGFVSGGTTVTVGGQPCASVTVTGPSSLTCVTPAGVAGTAADIVATTAGGTSSAISFTYDPVPVVSGVSPANGPVAGGTAITVSGTGFVVGDTTVQLGGVPCASVSVTSATSLTCVTPAGVAGTVSVLVFTPGGGSNAGVFTYNGVPTLASINPAAGLLAGGTTITLLGSEFVAGSTTVTIGGNPCSGVAVASPTELACVTPAGAPGPASVLVTTPGGTSNAVAFTFNSPPVAHDDAYSTPSNVKLVISAPGLLANDSDADPNQRLTAIQAGGPARGVLALAADGGFEYTPNPTLCSADSTDSFAYYANDSVANSNLVTVTITLQCANRAPVANADSYTIQQGVQLAIPPPGLLINDTDADGNRLTAVLVTSTTRGALGFNPDGSFSYLAPTAGTDSFTYKVTDGALESAPVTVTLNVTATNRPPLTFGDSYATAKNRVLTVAAPGVLKNDTDPDGNALRLASVLAQPAHGTLVTKPDGSFTFTPANNFVGLDSFDYAVTDGAATSPAARVVIDVRDANFPPVAHDDAYSTPSNTKLVVTTPGLLANDSDPDANQPLAVVIAANPRAGKLTLGAGGGFEYTPNAAPCSADSTDSFTYYANDSVVNSNAATVTISIHCANRAPVANADSYTIQQGVQLAIPPPGLLVNDTDADGNRLTAVLVTSTTRGALGFNPDGSFSYLAPTAGTDSFTYKATDGALESAPVTVTLNVTATNRPPLAAGDAYTITKNGVLTVAAPGVLANDRDPDGNPLSLASVLAQPAHGTLATRLDGGFTYTPANNYVGLDSFDYAVTDGTATSPAAKVVIDVRDANFPPVASDDSYTTQYNVKLVVPAPGLLANDSDPDGNQPLTVVLAQKPKGGKLALLPGGGFEYKPDPSPCVGDRIDNFSYYANDSVADSNLAHVSLLMRCTNLSPLARPDSYAMVQGTQLTVPSPGVLANDTDADGNALTMVVVTQPANGVLAPHPDGSFSYTPNASFIGTDSFTYKAHDGALDSTPVAVTVSVSAANNPPLAAADRYRTTKGVALKIAAPGVLANDSDPDGNGLRAQPQSPPANGTLQLASGGGFVYTPAVNFVGTDSFTYQASDGSLGSAPATVVIDVADAPATGTLSVTPASQTFSGQSMSTTAPGQVVAIANTGGAALTLNQIAATAPFGVTHNCGSLPATLGPGASCNAAVTVTPPAEGPVTGTLTVTASVGTQSVTLTGTGERSLITHYYLSILSRPPDAPGKAFWESEAARVQALGVDVNEVWYAMAQTFFGSAEYRIFRRDDAGFVADQYETFFNRAADASGFAFWTQQLALGMPREVVLTSFLFSPEFANFTRSLFGTTTVRKEIDTVTDFYRGILGRLPDDGGFKYWLQRFRAAQCAGGAAVNAEVEAISSQFTLSAEYAARARSNSQYVGDMYNAFLRRGGDLAGVQYWIGVLDGGLETREAVRKGFVSSPEFQARVAAIIAEGCVR